MAETLKKTDKKENITSKKASDNNTPTKKIITKKIVKKVVKKKKIEDKKIETPKNIETKQNQLKKIIVKKKVVVKKKAEKEKAENENVIVSAEPVTKENPKEEKNSTQNNLMKNFLKVEDVPILKDIYDNSLTISIIVKDGLIDYINVSGLEILEYRKDDIIGKDFLEIVSEDNWVYFTEDIKDLITKNINREVHLIKKNKEKIAVLCSAQFIKCQKSFIFSIEALSVRHIRNQLDDASEVNIYNDGDLQEDVKYGVMIDKLTGLPTFHLYEDRLQMAIARSVRHAHGNAKSAQKKIGVVCVKVDKINDIEKSYNTETKNYILQTIGMRMVSSLRQEDTVAKGVEEDFIIVCENASGIEDIETVIRRLLGGILEKIYFEREEHNITCSIGASMFPNHGVNPTRLLDAARKAMNTVIENGGQSYRTFEPERD